MNKSNFFSTLSKYKKRTAIIDDNLNKKNFGELLNDSHLFRRTDFKKKVVLIFCGNNYETIAGYVGLIRNNTIPFLIDENINKEKINEILKKYKINYIFLNKNINYGFTNYKKEFVFLNYHMIKINNYNKYKIFKNLILLLSTSGSTASPKCVRLSEENLISNTKSIIKSLKIKKTHRAITTLNPSYSYGLSIINTHLLSGACIVINKFTFFDKQFWSLLNKSASNTFGGVPVHYDILKKIKFENYNLSKITYLTHAGGIIDQDTKDYILNVCRSKKIKFVSMYGATEASPRMSYLPWQQSNKRANCIGRAVFGGKFWLVNNSKKKINKKNTTGELVYSGNNVCLGYSNTYKDLKKKDINKKILKTGDLAKLSDDNFYYIVGRKSRFIKINGYRVDLDFLEKKLKQKKVICSCVGKDNLLKIFYNNTMFRNIILNTLKEFDNIKKQNINIIFTKDKSFFLKKGKI